MCCGGGKEVLFSWFQVHEIELSNKKKYLQNKTKQKNEITAKLADQSLGDKNKH